MPPASLLEVVAQAREQIAVWEPVAELTTSAGLGRGEELRGVEFEECTFAGSVFRDARILGCSFADCVFDGVDLSGADLTDSTFAGVEIRGGKALGVAWGKLANGSRLAAPIRFTGVRLDYGSFQGLDLRGTSFAECSLVEVDFDECDLREVDFAGARLDGARFARCDLREASLVGATGAFLDPRENRVAGLRIDLDAAPALLRPFGVVVDGP